MKWRWLIFKNHFIFAALAKKMRLGKEPLVKFTRETCLIKILLSKPCLKEMCKEISMSNTIDISIPSWMKWNKCLSILVPILFDWWESATRMIFQMVYAWSTNTCQMGQLLIDWYVKMGHLLYHGEIISGIFINHY